MIPFLNPDSDDGNKEVNTNLDWRRMTFGNLLTIVLMMIGFIGMGYSQGAQNQKANSDIADLKAQLSKIESASDALRGSQGEQRMTQSTLSDSLASIKEYMDRMDKHISSNDSRVTALEQVEGSLNTSLKLLDQEIRYLGDHRGTTK